MEFKQKVKNIGAVAVILCIIGFMGVAGGVENLPAEAGFKEWFALAGAAVTCAMLGLFGVSLINEE